MTLSIGSGGVVREALEIHIGSGGAVRQVLEGWVGAGGTKRQFHASTPEPPPPPPLSVTASPEALDWQVVNPGSFYVSAETTVTVSGGTAPYSYAWRLSSGLAGANSDTSATTSFYSGDGAAATAICTVTDSDFFSADSNPVSLI